MNYLINTYNAQLIADKNYLVKHEPIMIYECLKIRMLHLYISLLI